MRCSEKQKCGLGAVDCRSVLSAYMLPPSEDMVTFRWRPFPANRVRTVLEVECLLQLFRSRDCRTLLSRPFARLQAHKPNYPGADEASDRAHRHCRRVGNTSAPPLDGGQLRDSTCPSTQVSGNARQVRHFREPKPTCLKE